MFKLAFLVLAIVPIATAQLVAPSAIPSPYANNAISGETAEASEQAVPSQTTNAVMGESKPVQKTGASAKVGDGPDYGQQTKRFLYIVPNFNAISAGTLAHYPSHFLCPNRIPKWTNSRDRVTISGHCVSSAVACGAPGMARSA